MAWILGIDEAGYGPNLGPFVMSAVACRAPDVGCLWERLQSAARRAADGRDDRLIFDDSKAVYAGGLAALERGVRAAISLPPTLGELVARLAPDGITDLAAEAWYTGRTALPANATDHAECLRRFAECCDGGGVGDWRIASVVVCPPRFNALIDRHDSKSAVLGHGFIELFSRALLECDGDEPLEVFVDKQGGRNTYTAQIQQALALGNVRPLEEGAARSVYSVAGLGRDVRLTFMPRADQSVFCVALASMVSKYLRELFMGEFNAFWAALVPGLKPTAGYPGDAVRYFASIRDAMTAARIDEGAVWRKR